MADNFYSKTSNNKIKLTINGKEIPIGSGMSAYSFYDAKSFFKEPVRSATGVINNLNSYATFLTPRLKFSFKFMPIGAYRILMKMLKEYNEFIVTAYDIVEDVYVTHKMYFTPKDFPTIFQKSLEVLAIMDEGFELVGTNASLETYSIVYNNNSTPVVTSGLEFYYGEEVRVGDYTEESDESVDPTTFTKSGYRLNNWNTSADGSGYQYVTGEVVSLTNSMVLYAQWIPATSFILSFDYQGATGGIDTINKEVENNAPVGELPTPTRTGYEFGGWFTLSNGEGTQIISTTAFTYARNLTVYAKWTEVVENE